MSNADSSPSTFATSAYRCIASTLLSLFIAINVPAWVHGAEDFSPLHEDNWYQIEFLLFERAIAPSAPITPDPEAPENQQLADGTEPIGVSDASQDPAEEALLFDAPLPLPVNAIQLWPARDWQPRPQNVSQWQAVANSFPFAPSATIVPPGFTVEAIEAMAWASNLELRYRNQDSADVLENAANLTMEVPQRLAADGDLSRTTAAGYGEEDIATLLSQTNNAENAAPGESGSNAVSSPFAAFMQEEASAESDRSSDQNSGQDLQRFVAEADPEAPPPPPVAADQAWYSVSNTELSLADAAQKLQRRGYNVALHQLWRAPLLNPEQHLDYADYLEQQFEKADAPGGEQPSRKWQLPMNQGVAFLIQEENLERQVYGAIKITRRRFLHAHLQLSLRDEISGKWFQLDQHRRLRRDELHYLDHPRFGALLRISAWRPSEDVTVTDAQR